MLAKVQGGTGAGCAMHRRKTIAKSAWTCSENHRNPWFATTCLTHRCRETRPAT